MITENEEELHKFIYNLLKNKYDYEIHRFEGLDSKGSSLLNINILVFTIQLSFISATVLELFINPNYFINTTKIVFLLIFILNIIANSFSLYNLYNSYKLTYYASALTENIILGYYLNKKNFKYIIAEVISSLDYAIGYNSNIITEKTEYIRKGSKMLVISIFLLLTDIIIILINLLVII